MAFPGNPAGLVYHFLDGPEISGEVYQLPIAQEEGRQLVTLVVVMGTVAGSFPPNSNDNGGCFFQPELGNEVRETPVHTAWA